MDQPQGQRYREGRRYPQLQALQGKGCKMKDFIWFWKASKRFTNYSWPKLLILGIVPWFRFMRMSSKGRRGGVA
jgi:hypothetical protein